MSDGERKKGFWQTLPGILTALATFIGAVGGLIAVLFQVGVFGIENRTTRGNGSGQTIDSTPVTTPVRTAAARVPIPAVPQNGSTVSQGYLFPWRFKWDEPSERGVRQYHLRVFGANAVNPAVDVKTKQTSFRRSDERRSCSYVTDGNRNGWTWKVRAQFGDGTWGPWSEPSTFDVERYDKARYCQKCPTTPICE